MILKKTSVSPSQITVSGSDENLKKIKRVTAKVNETKTLSEDTTISTSDLVFYDENNNKLSSENYTMDNHNFDVTFSLYKEKSVTLNVDFKDCPPNFNITSLPYKLSTEKIDVISPDINGSSVSTKTIGTISLSEVDLSETFGFEIPFEKNEENLSNISKVNVTFDDSGYTKKSFTISLDDFVVVNKPSGKEVKLNSPSKITAVIIGPQSVLSNLEATDLTAEIDLEDITKTGSITKKITVYSKKYNNIWCYGTYESQITIS